MKNVFIITLACLLLSTWSCKKHDAIPASGDRLDSLTVRKLYNNSISYTRKYSYDSAGNLVSLNHANGDNIFTFNYNSEGRLQSVKLTQSLTIEIMTNSFIYDGSGKIIRKTGTPILPGLEIDDHTFGYDSQERLISDTQHYRQTSTITGYRTFAYNNNDDVAEEDFFSMTPAGEPVPGGGIVYSYDNKFNPYNKIRIPSYMTNEDIFYLSKHNIVSRAASSGPGQYLSPTTYTYSNFDLPLTASLGTPGDSNSESWEFIYN